MPYPGWLGDSTLGDLGGGGGFPPAPPTLANLGTAVVPDPFADRYGQWQSARSPGGLPAWQPAPPAAPPPQPGYMGPARYEELQQPPAPPAAAPVLANAPPFWQRFLGALGRQPLRSQARLAAYPTPQLTGFHYSPVGRRGVSGV